MLSGLPQSPGVDVLNRTTQATLQNLKAAAETMQLTLHARLTEVLRVAGGNVKACVHSKNPVGGVLCDSAHGCLKMLDRSNTAAAL